MKTFTLRLTDLEAEALERLAHVNGESKNRMITSLIANEYGRTDTDSIILNGEVVSMTLGKDFYRGVIAAFWEKAVGDSVPDAELAKTLRAIEYSKDKANDPDEIEAMEQEKERIIQAFYFE